MMRAPRRRNAILEGMIQLRKISPTINLTGAIAFFYIAENAGINISELAELTNVELSTASRIVKSLAQSDCSAAQTAQRRGLIEIYDNLHDGRGRVLHLSAAGAELCASLDEVITHATPITLRAVRRSEK